MDARLRDGSEIRVELVVTALSRRSGYVFNGFIRDLTRQLAIEAQLRQAQKMEAIGNLSGGMAHDFNNHLGVIILNLDMAREILVDNPEADELVREAMASALRGAELINRLLAFARR
jgi:signal transduction histidine kinase